MRMFTLPLLLVVACGGSGTPSGNAPQVSDLSYQPQTATVGQQVTVTGMLSFTDSDADVTRGAVEVRPPERPLIAGVPFPVPGAAAQTRGAVSFAFAFTPPVAGRHEFDIWLIDGKGNASNRLTGALSAE